MTGLDIAILAGQSNMAGRGPVNTAEEIYDDRILVRKHNCWEVMKEPIHNDSGSAGIGPEHHLQKNTWIFLIGK